MITWLLLIVFLLWIRERSMRDRYQQTLAEFAADVAEMQRQDARAERVEVLS